MGPTVSGSPMRVNKKHEQITAYVPYFVFSFIFWTFKHEVFDLRNLQA